ncbi:MAG: hypothetical protein NTY79_03145 [Chloroflexi bacterium]|nr:hypothetical protein [Chloroflexota bacterium]
MSNKKTLAAGLLISVIAIIVPVACAPSPSPAQFEIASLDIKPAEVTVGDTVSISAKITNIGGTGGAYSATLSVDGKRIDTKYINVDPGSSQTVTFSLSKDAAGTYEIGIGTRSATLTVNSKRVAMPVELKYDDGVAKDCLSLVKPCTGYSVAFVSPPDPFSINKVTVFGLVYGSPGYNIGDCDLQICDKDNKVLYTTSFPGDRFPLRTRLGSNIDSTGGWADIEIPDVEVQGDFYIHIYTGIPTGQGFRMGAASNVVNTHSDVTVRDDKGVDNLAPGWPYSVAPWFGDKSRVNWMVRVSGNAMVPQE